MLRTKSVVIAIALAVTAFAADVTIAHHGWSGYIHEAGSGEQTLDRCAGTAIANGTPRDLS
jgi:hypothetical protein